MRPKYLPVAAALAAALCPCAHVRAHNNVPTPWKVNSVGVPAATAITIDAADGDWPASAVAFAIADYGPVGMGVSPLSATARALHKADGVYVFMRVTDSSSNGNDLVQIRLDVDHDDGPGVEAGDFGVEVRRDGQATWGPANVDPSTWTAVPAGTVAVVDGSPWRFELHVPTGAPAGIDLATGSVGVHFMMYDLDQLFGANSAKYTQWPQPTAAAAEGLDTLFDGTPGNWGDYVFDPATTFPDVSITNVRNVFDGAANYGKISRADTNTFEVTLQNPGGGAVPTPANGRINLYLAARGLGESWHRIDAAATLDADCALPAFPTALLTKPDVCTGSASLADISAASINDIVNNVAKYTTKLGDTMTRTGGASMTVPVGTTAVNVLDWNTSAAQDPKYDEVVVGGTTYRRQHQCMTAELLLPGDPNPANNLRQVNMDFVAMAAMKAFKADFSVGWAAFARYDPARGDKMFLRLATRNVDPQLGWKIELQNVDRLGDGAWVAPVKGTLSRPVSIEIAAPAEDRLGRPLKRNLMVGPRAGGRQAPKPSGDRPVYVRVSAGSTIQVASFQFDAADLQLVDLDGKLKVFRPNGPSGQPTPPRAALPKDRLLVPGAPAGALVGSFDDFKTGFLVAEGVEARVPANAKYLALGVNDLSGRFADNTGTGFRVRVLEARTKEAPTAEAEVAAEAVSRAVRVRPLREVMPVACVQGFTRTGAKREVAGASRELYRFVGDVCWGVLAVFDPERSKVPDKSDVPGGNDEPPVPVG